MIFASEYSRPVEEKGSTFAFEIENGMGREIKSKLGMEMTLNPESQKKKQSQHSHTVWEQASLWDTASVHAEIPDEAERIGLSD